MPYEVDPLFQTRALQSRRRRRHRLAVRIAAVVLGLTLTGSVMFFVMRPSPTDAPIVQTEALETEPFGLVQSEETSASGAAFERMASFVDLRRDPMILRLAAAGPDKNKSLSAGIGLAPTRLAQAGSGAITGLRDTLFVAERRLRTRLPSSHEDFALFNAQRRQGVEDRATRVAAAPVAEGRKVSVREESSWGDLVGSDTDSGAAQAAVYVETLIENTTSVAVARTEPNRSLLFVDDIIVLRSARDLVDVLVSAGIAQSESVAIEQAAVRAFALETLLEGGSVVALRLQPGAQGRHLLHMSLYTAAGYLGSLAQVGAGRFERASDPWINEDLLSRSDKDAGSDQPPQTMRLLDAVYAAGIRNGLSTKLVGEMIVLLSKQFDLERFVAEGDELVMLNATHPTQEATGTGQILYAGIHTQTDVMPCYVMAADDTGSFACFDFDRRGEYEAQGRLGGGLLVPVKGVKTSGFGPRRHPVLGQVRKHNGVDWAAPTGTPVLAAASGVVAYQGDGGTYGNVVYLDHEEGAQTRYAHLNGFAEGLTKGSKVSAGETIGFVGTTGRSTGPHLHFELRVGGKPLDPLSYAGGGTGPTQAVEALVDQIIRVESGGISTAKNPRSTATGLGQFIQSTWLRMMRDYRPDLVGELDRAALLALRNDPALSREMIRHLARENESYLRRKGHRIDAGRLYLAHFLGPEGAHRALGADVEASVEAVMGKKVVDANPFLRGKNIGALQAWAQRKMKQRGGAAPVRRARIIPPEAVAYRAAIDQLLSQI